MLKFSGLGRRVSLRGHCIRGFSKRYASWLWLFTMCLPAAAQVNSGPGVDLTPVELPKISKTLAHAITSIELLNLRDLHGIQISPDGKYVAFVVGQAIYGINSYRSGLFVVGTEKGSKPTCLGTAV